MILTNPSNCLITIKERKLNYAYLIIEKFTYLDGVSKPDILIKYNNKMKDFLNNTEDFDGAYGPRISNGNQFKHAYHLLKKDKDSRQAIITINDFRDRHNSKDKPCTLSLQFLIRNNKLIMITNMRSNDILWGTCLDIPAFVFLGEVMAYWLNIKFDKYIHQPASLHYYDNFEEKISNILENNDYGTSEIKSWLLTNKEKNTNWDVKYSEIDSALTAFWYNEELLRNNKPFAKTKWHSINDYLKRLELYWKTKLLT